MLRGNGVVEAIPLTIERGLRAAAGMNPGHAALVVDDATLSYGALVEAVDRVAAALRMSGILPGDRVAILAPNCLEYMELVIGIAASGAIAVLLPPTSSAEEIKQMVAGTAPRLAFLHPACGDRASMIEATVSQTIVLDRGYTLLKERAPAGSAARGPGEDDIFCIHFTSGSTGTPKGVMLSHRSRALSAYVVALEQGSYSPTDQALVTTPLFHGAGLLAALVPLLTGATCVVMPRFDIEAALSLIERRRLTVAQLIPTHFSALFNFEDGGGRRYDLSSLNAVASGTAPLSQTAKERICDRFGRSVLFERYGGTEASVVTCLRPNQQLRKNGSVGLPLCWVEVRLADAEGGSVQTGEIGEVWSRSPYSFSGYWENEKATAAAVREGGWYVSGDLARQDEEGYYYIVGRKNDMIISGGRNIFPREVEECLLRHPAIDDVAVVGIDDNYWGQRTVAFVVSRGATVGEQALIDFAKESLARFKAPKEVQFVDVLPRNKMGKVDRSALSDTYIAALAS